MNIFEKLNLAREKFHQLKLTKTGHNKFAGYNYFELGDFLIPALRVFKEVGLTAVVSFDKEMATMQIIDIANPGDKSTVQAISITSPMGSAALKGCHEVQNIGAVETYQRRYLWVAALEIVEHDALDASEPIKKLEEREDLKPLLEASIEQAKGKKTRTKIMQISRSIAEHLTQGREMGALQEWEIACEDEELATDVWHRLTTPEQDKIRELRNNVKEPHAQV